MKKRILSILTCLALCLSLLPATVLPAQAASLTEFYYLDADGNAQKVTSSSVTINTVTVSDESWVGSDSPPASSGTISVWHVLSESSSSQGSNRITVSGHVNLVLLDGNTLGGDGNMTGIDVPSGSSLTIWAGNTSNSIQGTGAIAWSANYDTSSSAPRIGGAGEITINGGVIGVNAYNGAGISGSTVTINGGTVTADSASSAGISGDTVEINGGTVTAKADAYRYGALGGYSSDVTINGGTVTASNVNGTAVYVGSSGSFTVTGGTVKISGYTSSSTYNGIDGVQDAVISITGGAVSVSSVKSTVDVNVTGGLYINTDSNKSEEYSEPVVKLVGTSDATSDDSMTITLTQDMTIPAGATLTIQEGQKLVIESGVTLTNSGTIFLTNPSNDTISGSGTLTGTGSFQYSSTKLPGIDGWIYDGTDHKTELEAKFTNLSGSNTTPSFSGITATGVSWTSITGDVSVGFYRVLNSGEVQSNETSEVDDAPPNGYVARVTFGESATVDIPFIVTPFTVTTDMLTIKTNTAAYSGAAQTPTISLQLDNQTYPMHKSLKAAFANHYNNTYLPVLYNENQEKLPGTSVTDAGKYYVGVKVNEDTYNTVNFDLSAIALSYITLLPTYTITALAESEDTELTIELKVLSTTGTTDETTDAVTYYYTSQAIGFDPTVKYGTTTLVEGTDYEMTIKNSTGDTVTAEQVVEKGNYTVSVTTKGGNLPANKTAEVTFTVGEGARLKYNGTTRHYALYVTSGENSIDYKNTPVYGEKVYIGRAIANDYFSTNNTGQLYVKFYSYDPSITIGGQNNATEYGPNVADYFNDNGTLTEAGETYFKVCSEAIPFTHPNSIGADANMTPYTIRPEDVGRRLIGQISSSVQSGYLYTAIDKLYTISSDLPSDDAVQKATGGDLATGKSIDVANKHAGSYTFDLNTLLPELAEGLEYGTKTFTVQIGEDLTTANYYNATKGTYSVSTDGILTLPIQDVNSTTTGSVGTITVSVVTQTHDFTGKTATITVNTVNKKTPQGAPTLSTTTLTYGQSLGDITLSGSMTDSNTNAEVPGNFTWTVPNTVYTVGSHTPEWKFTPTNTSDYLTITGKADITVNQASRTISAPSLSGTAGTTSITLAAVQPSAGGGTVKYGYTATNSSAGIDNWQTGTTFSGLTAFTTYYFFSQVTGDANYADAVSPGQAITTAGDPVVFVTGVTLDATSASLTVGGTRTLTATVVPTNAANKAVSWSSSNTGVATVSNSGVVTAVSVGTATITVTTTDGSKTASCAITVTKATITATVTMANWTVGETASEPSVTSTPSTDSYTVHYKVKGADDSTYATTKPTEVGNYTVRVTIAGNDNYEGATATADFSILAAESEDGGGYTPPSTPSTPSTPGTPSVVSVTVPISGDDNTIHVKASVSGDKATIDEVDLTKLDTVIGDDVDTGVVTIDFSGLKTSKPITTVEIPADVVKQIAQAVSDPNNDAESLEIVFTDGTSIEFDAVALGEKSAQADGLDVTISIKHAEDAKPTAPQQETIGDRPAFDITVTSGGKPISDMGGSVTVHAPYELREGEEPRGIVVWYVDEQGNREACETSYDSVRQRVNWKTSHLSVYMIGYDEALAKSCPKDETCPMYPYTDVDVNAWYHDAVHYCMENGLMGSTSITESLFAPDATASRAMIATILHRMEGTPQPTTTGTFTDVADGLWYTEAVEWAAENGIVLGYNGKFDPDDPITREQFAVMLWRYAGSPAVTTTELDFTDADEVSDWAMEALIWAQENGIMQGYNNAVDPQGNASRSCVAQMFKIFLEKAAQ